MEAAAGTPDLSDLPPGGSLFFFQGSIAEAIARAQAHNLLLVVFVAGDNEESVSMELTTFQNPAVLEEVKAQSLILRLQEGSADAKNFSAIFPTRRVPTITFIGYKGSLLQQLEGYQETDAFLTALRHAISTFNTEVQRAVASAMVAFLSTANNMTASGSASSAPDSQSAGNSTVDDTTVSATSSSGMNAPASEPAGLLPRQTGEALDVGRARSPPDEARVISDSRILAGESISLRDTGGNTHMDTHASGPIPGAVRSSLPDSTAVPKQSATTGTAATPTTTSAAAATTSAAAATTTTAGAKQGIGKKAPLRREPSGSKPVRVRTGPFPLQVRLTNGETIQGTFESYQLLREVKNFVDLQRTDGNMEFQLAVPFPRKVFTEGDMDMALSKLDIGPRSALILVGSVNASDTPSHSRASANSVADNLSQSESTSGGSYVGRFLSFLSPYVYGRSADSSQDQSGSAAAASQMDATPTTSRALRQGSQPPMVNSSLPEPPFVTPYNGGSNQETSAQAGRLSQRRGGSGNLHTLRRDEDGTPTGNTYWNGNSTQFGGSDEAKED